MAENQQDKFPAQVNDNVVPLPPKTNIDRRNFFKLVGGALGGVVLVSLGSNSSARATSAIPQFYCTLPTGPEPTVLAAPSLLVSSAAQNLPKFVDALPIPNVVQPTGLHRGAPLYEIQMRQFTQKLHRDLPPTTLWGYDGVFPGPTFNVERNQEIFVRWMNKLPLQHLLPRDTTLHGDEPDKPPVRTVVHLHGISTLPRSDGYPEAWFTKNFAQTGPEFKRELYNYPNSQRPTTLWYHDHALGITRLNVYAGLAGFYLIRSQAERDLNLPGGAYDIPLLIQDRMFNDDGSLFYPVVDLNGDTDPRLPPVWVPEFFGDTMVVNGKIWPYLEVEPRKYRFRLLNGSNARFYDLVLRLRNNAGEGPRFQVIGTDGGLLPQPYKRKNLIIAPAERYDVVVDFSEFKGAELVLHNSARAPYPSGAAYIPKQVMLFRVKSETNGPDTSDLPKKLFPVPALDPATAVRERDIAISAVFSPGFHAIRWDLNGHWTDPVGEEPHAGDVEIWRIINRGPSAHPIHLHQVNFQVLDRQSFNEAAFPERLELTGEAIKPPLDESPAWKDTVIATPRQVTRVIAKFDLPKGTNPTPGQRFRYVYHCHMIEHEDNEMMRPYDIVG